MGCARQGEAARHEVPAPAQVRSHHHRHEHDLGRGVQRDDGGEGAAGDLQGDRPRGPVEDVDAHPHRERGAERGYLLLTRDDTLFIEAGAEVEREEIKVDAEPVPLEASARLPHSIVHYVKRSLESLILEDAGTDGRFASDEYVVRAKPRSILCMPVMGQAKLVGVLYVENRLAAGVFTPGRLAVLEVLASQASISLANARLYASVQQAKEALRRSHDELEQRVEERARELRRAQAELLDTARRAGKAEIAAEVLHHAGNILNSINTSAGIVAAGCGSSACRSWRGPRRSCRRTNRTSGSSW
ncbi:GAF domain-containing protein [Cystobacter fuscus]